jgi:hypothetical protein
MDGIVTTIITVFISSGVTFLSVKIFTKLTSRNCVDCEAVNTLRAAVAVLIEYNETVPQGQKAKILTQLVGGKK